MMYFTPPVSSTKSPLNAHETSNLLPFTCWAVFNISSQLLSFKEKKYISSWLRVKVTWFILSPGPSHPPVNVSGGRLSSTSLFIYWAPVPLQHRGGLILGYNVSLWTPENDSSTNITFTTEREEITIKDLDKFTPYLMTVSAFNEFGDGVFSDPIEIWTDEDGRWKAKRLRITFYPCPLQFLLLL